MTEHHLQNDHDGVSDAQAFLAGASSAEAADSQKDSAATPNSALSRRVTFSDDHIVHQMPGAPSSAGWESEAAADAETGCWQAFNARVKALKRDVLALYYAGEAAAALYYAGEAAAALYYAGEAAAALYYAGEAAAALYYAVHDPRTPVLSKLLPWLVLAYALSPLDLIPDFIPVLGLLDDMLLLPLGLWVSYKLIPAQVMQECRQRAEEEPLLLERNWVVAVLVFVLWTAGLLLLVHWLVRQYGDDDLRPYEWAVLAGTGGVAAIVFSVWMISRLRYEARRRDEWNVALLADAGRVL
uniref:DUF1232 domain-containing protein n=1 Tax=Tetradesmus obliquus TaxID=3088 RepID=A0A383VAP8_TETOB|eukprot:jgi/Sobl393_1/13278/SZX62655.1